MKTQWYVKIEGKWVPADDAADAAWWFYMGMPIALGEWWKEAA